MPAEKTPLKEPEARQVAAQTLEFDPLGDLWRFFTSTKVAVVLILVTLIAAFLGALFPQAPSWASSSPQDYAQWLNGIRQRHGGLTDFYNAIGLFDAYGSIWFRALCSLLIINTVTCTINRIPGIWRSVFGSKVVMGDGFFANSGHRASLPGMQLDRVTDTLRQARYRIKVAQDGATTYLYADRNAWAKLGTLGTHLSIVLFLAGAILGGLFGWANDEVVIGEGSSFTVPRGYNFQVRLNDFQEEWYIQGMPKSYSSDLSVIDGGQEVERKTIQVNDPLVYKGIKFSQAFYGVAPAVEVTDSQGKVVYSDIVQLGSSTSRANYEIGVLPLSANRYLTVGRPKNASGAAAARLDLTVYSGSAKETSILDLNKSVKSGDSTITFVGDREYTGLRVSTDPGTPIIWIASALMLLGMCSTFYFPRRRLWVRVRSQSVDMAAFADRAVQIDQELDTLAKSMSPDRIAPKKHNKRNS